MWLLVEHLPNSTHGRKTMQNCTRKLALVKVFDDYVNCYYRTSSVFAVCFNISELPVHTSSLPRARYIDGCTIEFKLDTQPSRGQPYLVLRSVRPDVLLRYQPPQYERTIIKFSALGPGRRCVIIRSSLSLARERSAATRRLHVLWSSIPRVWYVLSPDDAIESVEVDQAEQRYVMSFWRA
jgi:hypothetical protein